MVNSRNIMCWVFSRMYIHRHTHTHTHIHTNAHKLTNGRVYINRCVYKWCVRKRGGKKYIYLCGRQSFWRVTHFSLVRVRSASVLLLLYRRQHARLTARLAAIIIIRCVVCAPIIYLYNILVLLTIRKDFENGHYIVSPCELRIMCHGIMFVIVAANDGGWDSFAHKIVNGENLFDQFRRS